MRTMILILVLALTLSIGTFAKVTVEGTPPAKAREGAYDVSKFLADIESNKIVLIDVRTFGEYVKGHLPGAVNVPIASSLENELKNFNVNKPIVFVCALGKRAGAAYHMVKDKRPEISDKVFFLDATVRYLPNGEVVITPNRD